MRLTLVRHAESTWNATGQWQGQSDVPLSPRGHLQARAVAARLFDRAWARRLCSDLSRAATTSDAIGEGAERDRRLREIDVGAWAGLTRREAAERFPDEVRGLMAGESVRIGGGESIEELEARVDGVLEELRERHPGEAVLAVTHGGVIRAAVGGVIGFRGRTSPLVGVGNTALTVLVERGDGELAIEAYNDGLHLDPADRDTGVPASRGVVSRLALVAIDPAAPSERRTADAILAHLGIAQIYSVGLARVGELAQQLLADPLDTLVLEDLRAEHGEADFALVLTPERVAELTARLLGVERAGAFAPPPPASVAQLRLGEERAELFSYGVRPA